MSSLHSTKRKSLAPSTDSLPSKTSASTTSSPAAKRLRTSPPPPAHPSLPSKPTAPLPPPIPSPTLHPLPPTSSVPKKRATKKPKLPKATTLPRPKIVKLVPPRPKGSSLPSGSAVTGPTGQIKGRDVVLVSRKVGLGALMRRCRGLLVEEGLEQITLHALTASIPHSLTLLHALLAILPFPHQFVSHSIITSSVRVTDDIIPEELGPDEVEEDGEEEGSSLRGRWCAGIEVVIRVGGSSGRGLKVGEGEKKKHKRAKRKSKAALAELTDEGGLPGLRDRKGIKKGKGKGKQGGKSQGDGRKDGKAMDGLVSSQRDEMSVDEGERDDSRGGGGGAQADMDDEEMAMNG